MEAQMNKRERVETCAKILESRGRIVKRRLTVLKVKKPLVDY